MLFRTNGGVRLDPIRTLRLDMPMIVGPLPYTDGHTLELSHGQEIGTTVHGT